jgi:hypothetical protein
VIGGLTLATAATLFFVPAVFAIFHSRSDRARAGEARPVTQDAAAAVNESRKHI